MRKKKKSKKAEISADDTLRAFITIHINEEVGKIPASDRAHLVESIIELFGPSLVGTVKGAITLLTEEPDTEEEEEEDDEDEDEDEEDDEDEYEDDE